MKKLIACLLIILVIPLFGVSQDLDRDQAQIVISGQVIDVNSDQPLIGCHIFLSENHGTVSKKDGKFELVLPAAFLGNNLNFSYVGFETKSILLDEMVNRFSGIEMSQEVVMLEEIVIIADPWSDFREIIAELSVLYPEKEDLKAAILKELENLDSRFALNEEGSD